MAIFLFMDFIGRFADIFRFLQFLQTLQFDAARLGKMHLFSSSLIFLAGLFDLIMID